MRESKRGFVVFLIIMFTLSFAFAEMNLVITADTVDSSFDFFAQTNPNADSSFESYDLEIPNFPATMKKLYSSVSSKKLIMDSWAMDSDNDERDLNLVFEKSSAGEEVLNLSFSGEISGVYQMMLYDYGNDSGRSTLVGQSSVDDGEEYSTTISEALSYFTLHVDYLYCGDSVCSAGNGESCSSCSNDCGVCDGGSSGGGGGSSGGVTNDSSNLYESLEAVKLQEGYKKRLKVDSGFKFNYLNITHTIKVSSIVQKRVKITIYSNPISVFIEEGETKGVDVNLDGVDDLELSISNVTNEVDLFVRSLSDLGFRDVPLEDQIISLNEEISVFDERYQEAEGFNTMRIVVPIILLFVGVSTFIFGLFLLFRRSRVKEEDDTNVASDVSYVKPGLS